MTVVLPEIYSPRAVAQLIQSVDPTFHLPSEEQERIISITTNPLEPAVVIAGAGSGKTETIAARVVYLVANQIVRPDQILGLTFTRKAASELNLRIRKRLRQLQEAMDKAGIERTFSSLDTAISTYHSYAGRLLADHAIRYGIDAETQPLGEAALWMLANRIVREWDAEDFSHESSINTVVSDLLGLTSTALEHSVSTAQIREVDERLIAQLNALEGRQQNAEVRGVITTLQQRIAMLPMVDYFIAERRKNGELTFDDQIALAADIAQNFPDVAELERAKYPVVLLDEYQDTSQSQVRMLSALFGASHPVTAVGDPCQSIYTWRGASAGTISAFGKHFPPAMHEIYEENPKTTTFELLTTYRNDRSILQLANSISEGVRAVESLEVSPLKARSGAGDGKLDVAAFENIESEALGIAEYIAPLWNDPERLKIGSKAPKTFAVLARNRSQIPEIHKALLDNGIDAEVLGIGGLLHVAEIADVVALLKVISDPTAGASLMRHLTGPRVNLGPRDIAALGAYSRKLASSHFGDSRSLVKSIIEGNPESADADDQFLGSIIDALDEISGADARNFSSVGYERLVVLSEELRRLRSRAASPITDLVAEVERYLNVEAEVLLREPGAHGRRHLDRFMDEAAKFARSGGYLSAFLNWLDVASDREGGLKAGAPEIDSSVVQILTVHMSKGAEWDVVVVPGLAKGTFPSEKSMSPDNWIANERHIPFELRGDGEQLPQFSLQGATTFKEAKELINQYKESCRSFRIREEIRLGYVAMTRARTHLFCTTSFWRDGVKPVEPSSLFALAQEIAQTSDSVHQTIEQPHPDDRNPNELIDVTAQWPLDPIAHRRAEFDATVTTVEKAQPLDVNSTSANPKIQSWIDDARAIIEENLEYARGVQEVLLPTRLSTSSLVALHKSPEELAKNIRRPMPRAIDQYSARGTAFHAWVEHHLNGDQLFDDEDLDFFEPLEKDQKLDDLKAKWLASEWAALTPHRVEVGFETEIAGVLIRGRIDAVYKNGDSYEVVDWKTGSKVLDASSAVQLAVYRLAWAKLAGVSVDQVSAAFHYVPTNVIDRPVGLLSETELIQLIKQERV
jgi:DNA helicase-2/ATP-dependent DNA helicase PcrA